MPKQIVISTVAVFILFSSLSSCRIAEKMDAYIANEFNNKVPKPDKRKDSAIIVNSSILSDPNELSHTVKTNKNLFLLVYWKYDYRHTCTLNPAIGVDYIRKGIYQQAGRLKQKLNGQQLEITIEQIPNTFAIVDKGHVVLLIIQWDKFYVEPQRKEIIVTYRTLQNGVAMKSGKISVANIDKNKPMGLFQTWKGATREFLVRYNAAATEMSRTIVDKIIAEL